MRLFSFFFFFMLTIRATGQDVRVVEQKFDFREFRFDITVESSKPDLKLTEVGLYHNFILKPKEHPDYPVITIKPSANYLVDLIISSNYSFQASAPVLELRQNHKIRFTIGISTTTELIHSGVQRIKIKPALTFSDGSQVVLSEEAIYPSDFVDYCEKRIPSDSDLLKWSGSSDEKKREEAALLLCKSTLSESALKQICDKLW